MARVTFRHLDARTIDLPASRAWALPVTGQAGNASVTVPYDAPVASAVYLNPDGGSWLAIEDADLGRWTGIITTLDFGPDGLSVNALQPWALLSYRAVRPTGQAFDAQSRIGQVALAALRDSMDGLPWLRIGPAVIDGGVTVTEPVSFAGGSAWGALTALMGMGDEELAIDNATGQVTWGGALATGSLYPALLCEGGALTEVTTTVDATTRVAHVMARAGVDQYDAYAGEAAAGGWPAQATVGASAGGFALKAAAESAIGGRVRPRVTVTASVSREHAALREGQFVRLLLRHHGFTGGAMTCRVLSRAVDADAETIALTLETYDLTAGARPVPPAALPRNAIRPQGSLAGVMTALYRFAQELYFNQWGRFR